MIKKHKRILAGTAIVVGVVAVATATPLVIIDQVKKNKSKDEESSIKSVVKTLMSYEDKIILLSEIAEGNIIGKKANKDVILNKLIKIIGATNLKGTKIMISMVTDVGGQVATDTAITTNDQTIKIHVSKGDKKEIIDSYKVKRTKTNAEKQATTLAYFNVVEDSVDNKNILITAKTSVISSSNDLLSKIKIAIGSELTSDQKDSLSISSYTPWPKGETKTVILGIQENEQEKETVMLKVIHAQTNAEKVITTINKLNQLLNSKKIYIPKNLDVSDASKTLEAIKTSLGIYYTNGQRNIITNLKTTFGSWISPTTIASQNGAYTLEIVIDTSKYEYKIDLVLRTTAEETIYDTLDSEKDKYNNLSDLQKILLLESSSSGRISSHVNTPKIINFIKTLINEGNDIEITIKTNDVEISSNAQSIVILLSVDSSNHPVEIHGFSVKLNSA